jgi:biotin operon repressor
MHKRCIWRSPGKSVFAAAVVLYVLSDGRLHSNAELQHATGLCRRSVLRYLAALNHAGFALERDTVHGREAYYQLVSVTGAERIRTSLRERVA